MTQLNPSRGNTPALPKAAAKPVLTAQRWAEMHDALTLALDALGQKPKDLTEGLLAYSVINHRIALKIALWRTPTDSDAAPPSFDDLTVSEFLGLWDRLQPDEKLEVVASVRAANRSQAREVTP